MEIKNDRIQTVVRKVSRFVHHSSGAVANVIGATQLDPTPVIICNTLKLELLNVETHAERHTRPSARSLSIHLYIYRYDDLCVYVCVYIYIYIYIYVYRERDIDLSLSLSLST